MASFGICREDNTIFKKFNNLAPCDINKLNIKSHQEFSDAKGRIKT